MKFMCFWLPGILLGVVPWGIIFKSFYGLLVQGIGLVLLIIAMCMVFYK